MRWCKTEKKLKKDCLFTVCDLMWNRFFTSLWCETLISHGHVAPFPGVVRSM